MNVGEDVLRGVEEEYCGDGVEELFREGGWETGCAGCAFCGRGGTWTGGIGGGRAIGLFEGCCRDFEGWAGVQDELGVFKAQFRVRQSGMTRAGYMMWDMYAVELPTGLHMV